MSKTVAMAFGRFNPITKGHQFVVDKLNELKRTHGASARLYLSHTQGSKDPLSYSDKLKFTREVFGSIVVKSNIKTVVKALQDVEKSGADKIFLVAGGTSRIRDFEQMVKRLDSDTSVVVVSAGDRTDGGEKGDADDGVSASRMRTAAKAGDVKTFRQMAHNRLSENSLKQIFKTISGKEMKMQEETEIQEAVKLSDEGFELKVYIENNSDLYRRQIVPIIKNVQRKMKAGKYDHKKAPKLWLYLVDAGAQLYVKEFGARGDTVRDMFPKKVREAVAQEFANEYRDEIEAQGGTMIESLDEAVTAAQRIKTSLKRGRSMRKGTALRRKMDRGKRIIKKKRGKRLARSTMNARRTEVKAQRKRLTGGKAIKSGAGGVARRVRSSNLFAKSKGAQTRATRGTKPRARMLRKKIISSSYDALIIKANENETPLHVIVEIYNRGCAAYVVKPINTMNEAQYGFARVNSFINNGAARGMDIDLLELTENAGTPLHQVDFQLRGKTNPKDPANDLIKAIVSDAHNEAFGSRPRSVAFWKKIKTMQNANEAIQAAVNVINEERDSLKKKMKTKSKVGTGGVEQAVAPVGTMVAAFKKPSAGAGKSKFRKEDNSWASRAGAGEEGSNELRKAYGRDTPGQTQDINTMFDNYENTSKPKVADTYVQEYTKMEEAVKLKNVILRTVRRK